MHYRLRYSLIFLLIIFAVAMFSRHFGWYVSFPPTDKILHATFGAALGLLWLWLIKDSLSHSKYLTLTSIIAIAALGSVIWEFWEYFSIFVPYWAHYYVPELADSLVDIFSGMLGGVAAYALAHPYRIPQY